jgi:hypothetical protein
MEQEEEKKEKRKREDEEEIKKKKQREDAFYDSDDDFDKLEPHFQPGQMYNTKPSNEIPRTLISTPPISRGTYDKSKSASVPQIVRTIPVVSNSIGAAVSSNSNSNSITSYKLDPQMMMAAPLFGGLQIGVIVLEIDSHGEQPIYPKDEENMPLGAYSEIIRIYKVYSYMMPKAKHVSSYNSNVSFRPDSRLGDLNAFIESLDEIKNADISKTEWSDSANRPLSIGALNFAKQLTNNIRKGWDLDYQKYVEEETSAYFKLMLITRFPSIDDRYIIPVANILSKDATSMDRFRISLNWLTYSFSGIDINDSIKSSELIKNECLERGEIKKNEAGRIVIEPDKQRELLARARTSPECSEYNRCFGDKTSGGVIGILKFAFNDGTNITFSPVKGNYFSLTQLKDWSVINKMFTKQTSSSSSSSSSSNSSSSSGGGYVPKTDNLIRLVKHLLGNFNTWIKNVYNPELAAAYSLTLQDIDSKKKIYDVNENTFKRYNFNDLCIIEMPMLLVSMLTTIILLFFKSVLEEADFDTDKYLIIEDEVPVIFSLLAHEINNNNFRSYTMNNSCTTLKPLFTREQQIEFPYSTDFRSPYQKKLADFFLTTVITGEEKSTPTLVHVQNNDNNYTSTNKQNKNIGMEKVRNWFIKETGDFPLDDLLKLHESSNSGSSISSSSNSGGGSATSSTSRAQLPDDYDDEQYRVNGNKGGGRKTKRAQKQRRTLKQRNKKSVTKKRRQRKTRRVTKRRL